jgi:hypothetical protein
MPRALPIRSTGRASFSMATEGILVWTIEGLMPGHNAIVLGIWSRPSGFDIMQTFGTSFDYAFLLAVQTRGSIIVAWRPTMWSLYGVSKRTYSLSATVLQLVIGAVWAITTVYGPAREEEKDDFLLEL